MSAVTVPFFVPGVCILLGAILVVVTQAIANRFYSYRAQKRADAVDLMRYRAGFSVFDKDSVG